MNETLQLENNLVIDGDVYRLEPLSWMQNKWLGEHIFKSIDLAALDYGMIHDLLREKGPLFMAICLLAPTESRAEHSRLPWTAIEQRAEEFSVSLSGEEVAKFGPRFFIFNPPQQLTLLMSGKKMAEQIGLALQSPAIGESGSSGALSRLPMATSPKSVLSSLSGDLPNPSPTSNAVLSDDKLTGQSSAGLALSSLG